MSTGSEWLTRVASNALQFINAPSTAEERMAAAAMAAIIVGGIAVVSRRRGRDDGLHEGGLSSRGTRTLRAHGDRAQAVIDRFGKIWGEAKADQYDPTANPSGWVVTMTAENKLSYGILEDALKQASLSVPAASAGYGEYRGIPRFRKALAAFFRAHMFTDDVAVDPEHFVVSAGVASVVDAVFYNLIDDGDGVLVPTPCYSSHFRNMSIRSGARFVPVPSEGNAFVVTPEMLSATMALHSRRVHPKRIRGLLLTNPNNPTGTIATIEDLRAIIQWCADNRVHLVSDEVYATSTFGGRAFVSVAQVARSMEGVDMDYVHAIWGLSKDFCMSGNRCGVLYSTNAKLVRAMEELGVSNGVGNFFQRPGPPQSLPQQSFLVRVNARSKHTLATVFEDEELIAKYIEANRANLRRSLGVIASGLAALEIPFVRPDGGLFVWMDLRGIVDGLPAARINETLIRRCKILMTPGTMAYGEDGFFRCCFACVPVATLEEFLRRLRALKTGNKKRGTLVDFISQHAHDAPA